MVVNFRKRFLYQAVRAIPDFQWERVAGWLGLPIVASRAWHERQPAVILAGLVLSIFISFTEITPETLIHTTLFAIFGIFAIFPFAADW